MVTKLFSISSFAKARMKSSSISSADFVFYLNNLGSVIVWE